MSSVITGNFGYQPTAPKAAANVAVELNKMKGISETAAPESKEKAETVQAEQAVTTDELGEAVENINQFVNSQGRTLNFSVDEESGKPIVKVIDFETKEVIRQIPSEEVLTMAKAIKRLQEDLGSATGLMFDKTI
ncbi:MAG TPA: flagellar protein FlaG [Rheinheimera sp.]|uniref:flagellar protein FlaG n=1 Tax=Rheinheimera sp. TaxID=1869214 RepID=UPI002B47E0E1|nr:flagellar protein FlaG [Rheinheimera sp.]HJS14255.1 flagellar protein FlaG [Rheinheimera sp.]